MSMIRFGWMWDGICFTALWTDRSRPLGMHTWWRQEFLPATATGMQPRWPTCLWTSCPVLAHSNWDTCPVSKSKSALDSTLVIHYFAFMHKPTDSSFMKTMRSGYIHINPKQDIMLYSTPPFNIHNSSGSTVSCRLELIIHQGSVIYLNIVAVAQKPRMSRNAYCFSFIFQPLTSVYILHLEHNCPR